MFEQGAASDVARAVEDARLALVAGFTLPETVVPFGTKVIESGQGLYHESEQAFDAMENVDDVLDQLIARVVSEDRRDTKLDHFFRNLMMRNDGALIMKDQPNVPALFMSETAFGQFTNYEHRGKRLMPSSAMSYLSDDMTPIEHRARDVTAWIQRAQPPHKMKLRTRQKKGLPLEKGIAARELFAVTSLTYNTDGDVDKVAAMLKEMQLQGAKGRAKYDGEKWTITWLYHSTIGQGESVVAGEVFELAIVVGGADARNGGLWVQLRVRRNLCLHWIIIGTAPETVGRTTHNRRNLKGWIAEQVASALKRTDGFIQKWNSAWKTKLLGKDYSSPEDGFADLVGRNFLKAPAGSGLDKKEYIARLVSNHYAEKARSPFGYVSWADAINAATRMHEHAWKSPWAVEDQIEQGSALLQHVYVLDN